MARHREPEVGDRVTVGRREDQELNPDGMITAIYGDDVIVRYEGDDVKWEGDWIEWEGHRTCHKLVRINGVLHNPIILVEHPELAFKPGDSETFAISEFHRRWSSNDGGLGRWVLED